MYVEIMHLENQQLFVSIWYFSKYSFSLKILVVFMELKYPESYKQCGPLV